MQGHAASPPSGVKPPLILGCPHPPSRSYPEADPDLRVVPAYSDVVARYLRYPCQPQQLPPGLAAMDPRGIGWHLPMGLIAQLFGSSMAMWEASRLPTGCMLVRLPSKAPSTGAAKRQRSGKKRCSQ